MSAANRFSPVGNACALLQVVGEFSQCRFVGDRNRQSLYPADVQPVGLRVGMEQRLSDDVSVVDYLERRFHWIFGGHGLDSSLVSARRRP